MIINTAFAKRHALTLRTMKQPLPVKNVDGSSNKAGPIRYTTIQTIRIQTPDHHYHQERSEFYITDVGTHDIILGTDWLKAHNPELDWTTSRLRFSRCPPSCNLSSPTMTLTTTRSSKPAMYISSLEPCPPPPLTFPPLLPMLPHTFDSSIGFTNTSDRP
jgi:hypothetical protein